MISAKGFKIETFFALNQFEPPSLILGIELDLAGPYSLWPFLRAMEDAKNTNRCSSYRIRRDVRRAVDYQFARASNSANTTARGKIDQATNSGDDPFIDQDGG